MAKREINKKKTERLAKIKCDHQCLKYLITKKINDQILTTYYNIIIWKITRKIRNITKNVLFGIYRQIGVEYDFIK